MARQGDTSGVFAMTIVQILIIFLIFAVFGALISAMVHHTESAKVTISQCQDMYSNMTLMDECFKEFRQEIDP